MELQNELNKLQLWAGITSLFVILLAVFVVIVLIKLKLLDMVIREQSVSLNMLAGKLQISDRVLDEIAEENKIHSLRISELNEKFHELQDMYIMNEAAYQELQELLKLDGTL